MSRLKMYSKRFDIISNIEYVKPLRSERKVETRSSKDELLDLIYGVDSVTGLPKGDLAQFLSDKTNPQLRLFIEQNLMNENVSSNGLSLGNDVLNKFRSVITDDDLARFTRNHDESVEDYAARMSNELEEMRYQSWKKKHEQSIRKRLSEIARRDN